jgi:hypothetical protein
VLTDAIFESYTAQRLITVGANAPPGLLVQSAARAAIDPPIPMYTPNLPKAVITQSLLSLPQLESVVHASLAHRQFMPNGDGTGVGKGREIAGIILDFSATVARNLGEGAGRGHLAAGAVAPRRDQKLPNLPVLLSQGTVLRRYVPLQRGAA